MARIVGVDIPRNKKIAFSLCYIHGIGMSTALEICKTAKIDTDKRVQELSEKQISSIREVISSLEMNVEGELRSFNAMNIKRLKDVGAEVLGIGVVFPLMVKGQKQMLELVKVKKNYRFRKESYIKKNLR